MKYIKLFFLLFIGFTSVAINASEKDTAKPGAFDPVVGARLCTNGRFNPVARFSIFVPQGDKNKELINRYSNYLIPSKQEVIEKALTSTVCSNWQNTSKLIALVSCTLLEAYKRYPKILETEHSSYVSQKGSAGNRLEAADLRPDNAPKSVKNKAKGLALDDARKQVAYDCGKLFAISYLRSKIDPYLNKAVQKSNFLQSINTSDSQGAALVRYIANRVVYGTLDMGFDTGYNFILKVARNIT